jgi:predicted permease
MSSILLSLGDIIGGLFGLVFGILYFAFIAAIFYGNWKMYEKAGKPGWASIVPIYNIVVLHEIIGRDLIKILLLFIPIVNIYFFITLFVSLAKSFGRTGTGDYLLTIFFAPIHLGLGSAQYVGPVEGTVTTHNGFRTPPATY